MRQSSPREIPLRQRHLKEKLCRTLTVMPLLSSQVRLFFSRLSRLGYFSVKNRTLISSHALRPNPIRSPRYTKNSQAPHIPGSSNLAIGFRSHLLTYDMPLISLCIQNLQISGRWCSAWNPRWANFQVILCKPRLQAKTDAVTVEWHKIWGATTVIVKNNLFYDLHWSWRQDNGSKTTNGANTRCIVDCS